MKPLVRLWLDDIRDPAHHGCIGWTWAKTAQEAIAILATGRVVQASLDHDLTINQTIGMPDKEDTGYTVACWMEEHGVWPREGTRCHSMNPVGRQRIEAVIRKANAAGQGAAKPYPAPACSQSSSKGGGA